MCGSTLIYLSVCMPVRQGEYMTCSRHLSTQLVVPLLAVRIFVVMEWQDTVFVPCACASSTCDTMFLILDVLLRSCLLE